MSSTCESIPVLYIKAYNNFDVGFKIGNTFKHFIQEHVTTKTAELLYSFYKTEEGRKLYNAAVETTERCYPHIVEEIKGMAEGSDVSFERLFLQDMVSEILLHHSNKSNEKEVGHDSEIAGCTDIMVNTSDCRVLAHNEDWGTEVENRMYMVDVDLDKSALCEVNIKNQETINQVTARRNERYLACIFPGYLAGNTFYVNKTFAVSINSLVPKKVNHGAVPVDILLRALIGCESIEECVAVMKNDPVGCSYGININIASRKSDDMWTLEVYPDNDITVVDVQHISYSNSANRDSYYVHTNYYKHVKDAEESPGLDGTKAREATASQMSVPTCLQDVCNILGDTSSTIEPIYRTPGISFKIIHVATIASAVFDMNESVLRVYLTNPKTAKRPCLSLPFVQ
ncbi:uncharacterized protein LOC123557848 [Mercenaria mercenaria]|uniref:uncharacterized protein LOC123557848 n=1 Tax=Mercenaria mercenaria TaxID=6596 RepID=UPI00234F42AA|nr:uncharacterized protein LOC123557848 [Mercenaria mercenaria]